jgi:hypothetical protein
VLFTHTKKKPTNLEKIILKKFILQQLKRRFYENDKFLFTIFITKTYLPHAIVDDEKPHSLLQISTRLKSVLFPVTKQHHPTTLSITKLPS